MIRVTAAFILLFITSGLTTTSDVDTVAQFLDTLIRYHRPCTVVIGHDYLVTPPPLLRLLTDTMGLNNSVIILGPPSSIEDPVTTKPKKWFHWLQRTKTIRMFSCALIILICDNNRFAQMIEYVASKIHLQTDRDRFVIWSRDGGSDDLLLHQHSEILLYKMALSPTSDGLQLRTACFFCDMGDPIVVTVGTFKNSSAINGVQLTTGAVNQKVERLFPDWTTDLHGKHMSGYWLYHVSPARVKRDDDAYLPIFITDCVVDEMGRLLNFNYTIDRIPPAPKGQPLNVELPNGTWNGIVGSILYKTRNFTPNTPYTDTATAVVELPYPHLILHIIFVTRLPRPAYSWWAMVQPYTTSMWVLIALSCVCGAIFMSATLFALEHTAVEVFPHHERPRSGLFLYSLRYLFSTLIEENPSLVPIPHTPRVFLSFWWLFAILITFAYDCKLIAFLVAPTLEVLPINFQELDATPYWRYGMQITQAPFITAIVGRSDSAHLHRLMAKSETFPTLHDCVRRCIVNPDGETDEVGFACISNNLFLLKEASLMARLDGSLPIHTAHDMSIYVQFGPMLPKNSPLVPVFRRTIIRLYDSGLIERYNSEYLHRARVLGLRAARISPADESNEAVLKLNLQQIKGPLVFIAVFGWGFTLVVFVTEVVYAKKAKKNLI